VNNLSRVARGAERRQPGLEPVTSWLQIRRPNHYATTSHYAGRGHNNIMQAIIAINYTMVYY